jgi:hypothetical protein
MKNQQVKTPSGLTKSDLMYVQKGESRCIVSKKRHNSALKNEGLQAWLKFASMTYHTEVKPQGGTYSDALKLASKRYRS